MRCVVFSSTVGLGEVDTSMRRTGLATAGTAVTAGLAFGGVGAAVWADAEPASMSPASKADGTSRIACVKGYPPRSASRSPAARASPAPRKRHNALNFNNLADFAQPLEKTRSGPPRIIHHGHNVRQVWPPDGQAIPPDEIGAARAVSYTHLDVYKRQIQDIDEIVGYGAFWGEVQSNVHKALGALGVVTNGSIRDIPMIAPGFQMLAGSIVPSHAYVHVVDFGIDVNVHGMAVKSGDLIHADRHGAIVVPADKIEAMRKALEGLSAREAKIIAAAKAGGDVEAIKAAMKG